MRKLQRLEPTPMAGVIDPARKLQPLEFLIRAGEGVSMGDVLVTEVRQRYPGSPLSSEWLLLWDLACAASDETRHGSCSFDYMNNRASTCEMEPRSESDVRLWLDRLVYRGCITYCLEDDARGIMFEIGHIPVPGVPVETPAAPEKPDVPTDLYRHFDALDLLLYIGITNNLERRGADHAEGSSWMEFAVSSTTVRYPSRDAAEEAEEAAIKAEHPLFNHEHNDTPEARRGLVEYLVEHDRLDLLAPAVSRG